MKNPKFTTEQVPELLKNKHVIKCSSKAISYNRTFKVLAVRQYAEGMTAAQIFRDVGLPAELVGEHTATDQLRRWRKKFELRGESGLMIDGRGLTKGKGRPRTKGLTDADRIKRLEIEVAYLKAKNDFLVKLRAKMKS